MDAVLKEVQGRAFIDLTEGDFSIRREGEINDLLSLCYLHNTNFILIDASNLSDDFFNLRTGLAGAAIQKFANYQTKVAALLPVGYEHGERFKELMFEMNKNNHFRFFHDRTLAEAWLIKK